MSSFFPLKMPMISWLQSHRQLINLFPQQISICFLLSFLITSLPYRSLNSFWTKFACTCLAKNVTFILKREVAKKVWGLSRLDRRIMLVTRFPNWESFSVSSFHVVFEFFSAWLMLIFSHTFLDGISPDLTISWKLLILLVKWIGFDLDRRFLIWRAIF